MDLGEGKMPAKGSCVLPKETQDAIAHAYIQGGRYLSIARTHNTSESMVWRIVKERGVSRKRGSNRRYTLDQNAFGQWTPEASYWAGFLFADGSVTTIHHDNILVRLGVSHKDVGHLEKFKVFLKSDHKVQEYRHKHPPFYVDYSVAFSSREVGSRLKAVGIQTGRTSIHSDELVQSKDFWRGCVDGDGCLYWSKPKRGNSYPAISLCGHLGIVSQFVEYARPFIAGTKAKIGPNGSIYDFTVHGDYAVSLASHLYGSASVFLDRKKQLADSFSDGC